jgi:hypothetical protein
MRPVWDILVYVVLPLWVVMGFADYLCHRAGDMEHRFRINALLLALMIVALVAHEITGHVDLKLAMGTRKVTALEHQIHSFLDILPLTAFLLVCILHWPQTLALFGAGTEAADFSLGPKQPPRWGEIIPPFAAFALLVFAPYLEESWRGLKARKTTPHPET